MREQGLIRTVQGCFDPLPSLVGDLGQGGRAVPRHLTSGRTRRDGTLPRHRPGTDRRGRLGPGRGEATPRLELYPLDLERALRITQAIGSLGRLGVAPEQIRDRVRSRFPALPGELIAAAREADGVPYGLWLLFPMHSPQGPVTLDGRPAGVIADAEQALLPRGFTAPEAVPVG
ncbi:hypothetical protein [Nocardiopsis listeri]|uniref:hypothetical protein n=1 Tax=Nocardiopsis listeri TaxID=53440 RepID=UPI000A6420F7|nr:hypothetical protein [Nocardiopsis listeri]